MRGKSDDFGLAPILAVKQKELYDKKERTKELIKYSTCRC